jgi:Kdo2-lipid IVA lauroyltransferase/acyltransferase
MKTEHITFGLIRFLTFPAIWLSYQQLHSLGKFLGTLAYYCLPKFRKRALSNLALATDLPLSQKEIIRLAKESFQNLMITCLEYPKLASEKDISKVAYCTNPEPAASLLKEGKGVIFFCGHQANWEILFLEGTSRMPGVAIGRPIKNRLLYNWVLSIRQKFGGKIITPQNAIKEGLKGLKKGSFLGIVGDQGMPDSGFCSPFLGRLAWTSPIAAILSYRTGTPIIVATTLRENGKYRIDYSQPIWPNQNLPLETEIERLMNQSLKLLEESIKKEPGQWMWQHNRWKQQTPEKIKRRFRHDSLCIIFPSDKTEFDHIASHLPVFRKIYPLEFITLIIPEKFKHFTLLPDVEKITYQEYGDLLLEDFRFKLVFNFSAYKTLRAHFLSLSAFEVITLEDLKELADLETSQDLTQILEKSLCNAR